MRVLHGSLGPNMPRAWHHRRRQGPAIRGAGRAPRWRGGHVRGRGRAAARDQRRASHQPRGRLRAAPCCDGQGGPAARQHSTLPARPQLTSWPELGSCTSSWGAPGGSGRPEAPGREARAPGPQGERRLAAGRRHCLEPPHAPLPARYCSSHPPMQRARAPSRRACAPPSSSRRRHLRRRRLALQLVRRRRRSQHVQARPRRRTYSSTPPVRRYARARRSASCG